MRAVLRRNFVPLALAFIMVTSALTAGATVASAATTYGETYTIVKELYSQPVKRCIRVALWDNVQFQLKQRTQFGGIIEYVGRAIENPAIRASVLDKCGAGAEATRR
jgi:hypothetical protein